MAITHIYTHVRKSLYKHTTHTHTHVDLCLRKVKENVIYELNSLSLTHTLTTTEKKPLQKQNTPIECLQKPMS